MAGSRARANALDHVVVVLFENRSLDNVLGRLYGPGDGKTFEGVIGKGLSNPIPEWAEHGADRKVVPYGTATDMDSPNPDSGEEYYHTNTQLFNTIDDHNRFKIGAGVTDPWNAPPAGSTPTMDGFVTDYISTFTGEMGRQPTYEEYAHIMTGYTPQQVPVLSGVAREFGVFDHLFCEVPSQTFMNMISGHGDYHPAIGRAMGPNIDPGIDSPSSILAGEAFLERVFNAYRSATAASGSSVWNTTLLIGWDEPAAPMTMSPPVPCHHRIQPPPRGSSASRSIAPGTGFLRSSCRPGSRQGRCTTRNTATPR